MESGNQSLGDRQQVRADQVVTLARRHAEEIRAAAEQEADQLLRAAEREAALRQEERRAVAEQEADQLLRAAEREAARRRQEQREADERERTRVGVQKQQLIEGLDAAGAAMARLRELVAALPDAYPAPPAAASSAATVASAPLEPTGDAGRSRLRIMNSVAIVFGVWATVMVGILVMLSRQPSEADTASAGSAIDTAQATTAPATTESLDTPIDPEPTEAAPQAMAVVADVNASATSGEQDGELTVAFVADRDCWVSITRDEGPTTERLLKASERYVVRARDVVSFKAGNAAALTLLINDRPTRPLGAEGQVVTRRITRTNYRTFLAS